MDLRNPPGEWPQLTELLQFTMNNLKEIANRQRISVTRPIYRVSQLKWPTLFWHILFKDTDRQIGQVTDEYFKSHILQDCMNVMLIYGANGLRGEHTLLEDRGAPFPQLGWRIWGAKNAGKPSPSLSGRLASSRLPGSTPSCPHAANSY